MICSEEPRARDLRSAEILIYQWTVLAPIYSDLVSALLQLTVLYTMRTRTTTRVWARVRVESSSARVG